MENCACPRRRGEVSVNVSVRWGEIHARALRQETPNTSHVNLFVASGHDDWTHPACFPGAPARLMRRAPRRDAPVPPTIRRVRHGGRALGVSRNGSERKASLRPLCAAVLSHRERPAGKAAVTFCWVHPPSPPLLCGTFSAITPVGKYILVRRPRRVYFSWTIAPNVIERRDRVYVHVPAGKSGTSCPCNIENKLSRPCASSLGSDNEAPHDSQSMLVRPPVSQHIILLLYNPFKRLMDARSVRTHAKHDGHTTEARAAFRVDRATPDRVRMRSTLTRRMRWVWSSAPSAYAPSVAITCRAVGEDLYGPCATETSAVRLR